MFFGEEMGDRTRGTLKLKINADVRALLEEKKKEGIKKVMGPLLPGH